MYRNGYEFEVDAVSNHVVYYHLWSEGLTPVSERTYWTKLNQQLVPALEL